jgi:molybdenum cofactor biosynthesis protein B
MDDDGGTGGDDHDHGNGGGHDHRGTAHHHHDVGRLGVGLVTVSSTRTLAEDGAGDAVVGALEDAGHVVATRDLVGDDFDAIQSTVDRFVDRADVDCAVTVGGTGVTPDDVTVEAVEPLFEKRLPGFGELFRQYSREEVGTRVVATRATAGVVDTVPVFCLPGSENAARLGTERLVLAEAPHLVGLADRD